MNKIKDFDELNEYCCLQFSTLADSRSYLPQSMNRYIENQIQSRYKKAYKDIQQLEREEERAERKLFRQERRKAFFARLRAFFGFKTIVIENDVNTPGNAEQEPDKERNGSN